MKKTLVFFLAILLLADPCHADAGESGDPIMTTSLLQGINAVARATHRVPETISGQHVYLCITAGGGYTDVRVFAPSAVKPERFAQDLAAATKGTSLNGRPVTWETAGYSGAEVTENHGRLWGRGATNTVALGALESGLAARGYVPHLVLRTPEPAQFVVGDVHPVASVRRVRYFDRTALGAAPSVVLTTTVTPIALFLLGLLAAMPAIISAAFLILANRTSKKGNIPDEVRARKVLAYQSRAFVAPFLGQIPLTLVAVTTGILGSVTDAWYGTPLLRPMPPFFVYGFIPMLVLVMTVRIPVAAKEGETTAADDLAIRRRVSLAQGVFRFVSSVLVVCTALVNAAGNPFLRWLSPIGQIMVLLGISGWLQIYAFGLKKYIDCRRDDELTERLRRVGSRNGVRVRRAYRDCALRRNKVSFCWMKSRGNFVITDEMASTFTDDELAFIVTRVAISHTASAEKHNPVRPKVSWILLLLPIGALVWVQVSAPFAPPIVALLSLGYIAILMMGFASGVDIDEHAIRNRILEIDRRALQQTRSLEAAIGAVRKVTMREDIISNVAGDPFMSPAEVKLRGPSRQERIRNLEVAAEELGLS
jgi:hypothetical protein